MRCRECAAEADAQFCSQCGAAAVHQLSVAADPGARVTSSSDASAGQQLPPRPAPDSEAGGAMLGGWVEARRFSTTRLRPGYDQEEVDAFLTEIRDSFLGVRQPSLTPDEIRGKCFSTTRLRPGYDEKEVDDFLDEAELWLSAQVLPSGARPGKNDGACALRSSNSLRVHCAAAGGMEWSWSSLWIRVGVSSRRLSFAGRPAVTRRKARPVRRQSAGRRFRDACRVRGGWPALTTGSE